MFTELHPSFANDVRAQQAANWMAQCVHCGFCNATCPSYRLWSNELDSPRGRIYQIHDMLQGQAISPFMQQHLDLCLTCGGCETTCPSGVQYGKLIEAGRSLLAQRHRRPALQRAQRWLLRKALLSPLLPIAVRVGQALQRWLPWSHAGWRKLPPLPATEPLWRAGLNGWWRAGQLPQRWHSRQAQIATPDPALAIATTPPSSAIARPTHRKVILFQGCVQPSVLPQIDHATLRVLQACGIAVLPLKSRCCGALPAHLDDSAAALAHMRRNIDLWWPELQAGATAIVHNASACGLTVKEYGAQLAHDPAYASKAARVSAAACDLAELLLQTPPPRLRQADLPRLAYHPPCTLQHGQKLQGQVEAYLRSCGFEVELTRIDSHLCCGSAGAWSLLHPRAATELKQQKIRHLEAIGAQRIVSANVGCILHLYSASRLPVQHWIEVLAEHLDTALCSDMD